MLKNFPHQVYDSDYGQLHLSSLHNNGDWNYRLAVRVTNLEEYLTEEELKEAGLYNIEILAVSPQACQKKNVLIAFECHGTDEEIKIPRLDKEPHSLNKIFMRIYESIVEYGIFAMLWKKDGNDLDVLLEEADKESELITSLFGFYMDRPENGIGQTGWDLIAGQSPFNKLKGK